jgi:hypothetical protein
MRRERTTSARTKDVVHGSIERYHVTQDKNEKEINDDTSPDTNVSQPVPPTDTKKKIQA